MDTEGEELIHRNWRMGWKLMAGVNKWLWWLRVINGFCRGNFGREWEYLFFCRIMILWGIVMGERWRNGGW